MIRGSGANEIPVLNGYTLTIRREYIQLCATRESCQFRAVTSDQRHTTDHLMRGLSIAGSDSRLSICNSETFSFIRNPTCFYPASYGEYLSGRHKLEGLCNVLYI